MMSITRTFPVPTKNLGSKVRVDWHRRPIRDIRGPLKDQGIVTAQQTDSPDIGENIDAKDILQFSNSLDENFTILNICGRNDTSMLMQCTNLLEIKGIVVESASLNARQEGVVCNIFRITDKDGNKIKEEKWSELEADLMKLLGTSSKSLKPAIHGAIQLDDKSTIVKESDIIALEAAAGEMAKAAAELVSIEKGIIEKVTQSSSPEIIESMQIERAEANSLLERKISALEAILTTRRTLMEKSEIEIKKEAIPDYLMPPPISTTGPAAGNGYEIILQGFNWESCNKEWYKEIAEMAPDLASAGFTAIWLPPVSDSVSKQGYLPRDYYDLNSQYGTEAELREMIKTLQDYGLKPIADIVINHRCAHYQGEDGKWNKFGGRLAWDKSVICSNNHEFGGTGNMKAEEDYIAAPNIDHSQERVRKDIIEWLLWLRNSIGFAGWRFDFVKVRCCILFIIERLRLIMSFRSFRVMVENLWLNMSMPQSQSCLLVSIGIHAHIRMVY